MRSVRPVLSRFTMWVSVSRCMRLGRLCRCLGTDVVLMNLLVVRCVVRDLSAGLALATVVFGPVGLDVWSVLK